MQPERRSEQPSHLLRSAEVLRTHSKSIPLIFLRSQRARRYILRVTDEGLARVTIPQGGSRDKARLFARQHVTWVQKQLSQLALLPKPAHTLRIGDEILFRGRQVVLKAAGDALFLGSQPLRGGPADDLRIAVREQLWAIAKPEFVRRAFELATVHRVAVKRVVVRNQRTRWGSCSIHATICLNWRLIQAPTFVRDYLIVHELMHLREMNHSDRFWKHVAAACPNYQEAEVWLDDHDHLLRQG